MKMLQQIQNSKNSSFQLDITWKPSLFLKKTLQTVLKLNSLSLKLVSK